MYLRDQALLGAGELTQPIEPQHPNGGAREHADEASSPPAQRGQAASLATHSGDSARCSTHSCLLVSATCLYASLSRRSAMLSDRACAAGVAAVRDMVLTSAEVGGGRVWCTLISCPAWAERIFECYSWCLWIVLRLAFCSGAAAPLCEVSTATGFSTRHARACPPLPSSGVQVSKTIRARGIGCACRCCSASSGGFRAAQAKCRAAEERETQQGFRGRRRRGKHQPR